ncbi:MAG: hypothetical protein HY675_10305 [Chloroflexi bacterium]|nr:hypothetical protein [Chloroflexota bacterium]
MKKEFVIERHGKSFVLYAGLLDEGHAQGLKSIKTSLLQIPNESNGNVAICFATVETEKGTFTGIGDAAPFNVGREMSGCIVRMAETRAKARALRDAVNVGVAALEELGEVGDADDSAVSGNGSSGLDTSKQAFYSRPSPTNGSSTNGLATPAQVRAIYLIGRDQHGLTEAQLEEKVIAMYGCTPAELTKKQASDFITSMKSGVKR